ncbi:MAG: peptidylprolyl isomerase [Fimbriiglobus sp.]|nr:peptidylprolyl isomerase [Fimbriiglobus sp.]
MVVIVTSLGTIEAELFADKAPETVKNFLAYTDDKFYDGTIFHRVIKDFMIQGGGMEPGLKQKKTKDEIKNESDNGLSNARGTLAMARKKAADSATSQFFINTVDNDRLDKAKFPDKVGYCVFGKVTAGMDVVDKIREVKVGERNVDGIPYENVPTEDVVIKSVTRKKK